METITLSPLPEEIQAFVQHYQNYRMPSKNPYIAYFFKAPGATISIYTSGKVVLQGSKAESFAQALGYQQKNTNGHKCRTGLPTDWNRRSWKWLLLWRVGCCSLPSHT